MVTSSKFAGHTKSLNRLEHHTQLHFQGRTAADDVSKPSSRLPRDLVTRWSWSPDCRHFLSLIFGVDACFVFDFVVFYLWVNSDNITHCQSRHTAWFQIPYLGYCVLRRLTGKYHWSVQQNVWPIWYGNQSSSRSIWVCKEFGLKLIVFFFQKNMRILFTNRALPTIRHMDKILGKVSPLPNSLKITVAYGELRVYFAVQIPPFIDWTWTAEMTLSLQVDLVLSDAASTSEA